MGEAESLWSSCTEALRPLVPESAWKSCFHSTAAVSLNDHAFVVAAPSSFVKDRLDGSYATLIAEALALLGQGDVAFEVQVRPEVRPNELFPDAVDDAPPARADGDTPTSSAPRRADAPAPRP